MRWAWGVNELIFSLFEIETAQLRFWGAEKLLAVQKRAV
jgi:hypothetical protein